MAQRIRKHDDLLVLLKKRQGDRSVRAYAKDLGVDPTGLSKVLRGQKGIGPKLLAAMNLETVYKDRIA